MMPKRNQREIPVPESEPKLAVIAAQHETPRVNSVLKGQVADMINEEHEFRREVLNLLGKLSLRSHSEGQANDIRRPTSSAPVNLHPFSLRRRD